MIEVYKVLNGKYDREVSCLLPRRITKGDQVRTRGHSRKLIKKQATRDQSKHMFTRRVVDVWNKLPERVVSAPSLYSFENRLDKHWRNLNIMYDFEATLDLLGTAAQRTDHDDVDDQDLGMEDQRNH